MDKHTLLLPDGSTLSSGSYGSAIGSVKLTRTVNSGNELTPGSVCAAFAEIELLDTGGVCPLQTGEEFTLFCGDTQVGIFTVEDITRSGISRFSITAYDRVARLDRNLDKWLEGLTGWPYPLEEFTRMVCQECGVEAELTDLPNGVFPVRKFTVTEVTGRHLLGWAAQIMGLFCRAKPDGTLEFSWYTPAQKTIAPQTGENAVGFFAGSLKCSDYAVAPVDKVQIRSTDTDIGLIYPGEGGENCYIVNANPYLHGGEESLPVAEHLYTRLWEMTYTPGSVTVPAGYFHPGQQVQVTDSSGKSLLLLVMTAVQEGQRETLSCTGSPSRESITAVNSQSIERLTGKVLELRTDVDGLKTVNRDAESLAKLELTVQGIAAEVTRQSGSEAQLKEALTRVSQTADALSVELRKIGETGGGRVVTSTGYTFDDAGLHIKKAGEEMENRLDHTGMQVSRGGDVILRADAAGVAATDVQVNNYLIVGSHARFQDYAGGTGCFYL